MNKILGEAISESRALSLFLSGIKDPDFEMTVETRKNKDDNTLMQSMIYISKQYREVTKEGYTDSKFNNKPRHVCEEDDWYIDKDRPFKTSCRQGERDEDLFVTSYPNKLKGKFLHVVQRVWQKLDSKDK